MKEETTDSQPDDVQPPSGDEASRQKQAIPPPAPMKLTPELLEWARNQYSDEELVAALKEFREKGGLELHEFIHELEDAARVNE
jgi:hypothetical protein